MRGKRIAPDTPELDKFAAISDQRMVILEFLESCGYRLGEYVPYEEDRNEPFVPTLTSKDQILAKYFGIDLVKLEQDRRALLLWASGSVVGVEVKS